MRIVLFPYQIYSESSKALQEEIIANQVSCIRVYPDGNYIPRKGDLIINWGNSNWPLWGNKVKYIMNTPHRVSEAINKLKCFRIISKAVSCPHFTSDKREIKQFIEYYDIREWVARTKLEGSGGEGIILFKDGEEIPDASLYVEYIRKKYEYRVHVFNGQVIDIQQKRKKRGEAVDKKIRNHANGWVFSREDIDDEFGQLDYIKEMAVGAVNELMLEFGAVDIIYNSKRNKSYVLEVNTAPGLAGQTVKSYANAIMEYAKGN